MNSWPFLSLSSAFTAASQLMYFGYLHFTYASCTIEEYITAAEHLSYLARSGCGDTYYQLAAEGANLMVAIVFSIKFTLASLVALSLLSIAANISKNTFCMKFILVATGMLALHNIGIAVFAYANNLELSDFNCGKSPNCGLFFEFIIGTEIILFNLHCLYLQLYVLRRDDERIQFIPLQIPRPPPPPAA